VTLAGLAFRELGGHRGRIGVGARGLDAPPALGEEFPCEDSPGGLRDGKRRLEGLVDELDGAGYTAAAKCLADDLDALVVHLRYPTRHRRRWRSTNLLERSLAEVKRRTKVIGRFPGETSCLTLVWAVLDLYITHAKTASASANSNANTYAGSDTREANQPPPRR
jgi:hypothetical protein